MKPATFENRACLHCGASFEVRISPSREGRGKYCSRSCGVSAQMTKHGHGVRGMTSPTYVTWVAMRNRCHAPGNSKYYMYGARGIEVCQRWRDSFAAFLEDMGERPEGCTIDRIDGAKGYEPGNCRWATVKDQQRNLRTNVTITFQGESLCISEWAEKTGLHSRTIAHRLRRGWTAAQALTTPARLGNRIGRANA